MTLVDRYLNAVRQSMFLTPSATRNDILRELEEELRAQIDAKQGELGRSLTEIETDQILQRIGHPLLVAGRYREGSGTLAFGPQLIGPELFPLYRLILGVNLALTAIAMAIISMTMDVFDGIGGFLPHLAIQAAIITGIFIAADAGVRRKVSRGWSMLETPEPEERDRISRFSSIVEMMFAIFFANIWAELPLDSGSQRLSSGGDWTPGLVWNHFHTTFYIPILVVLIVPIALSFVNLIDPYRRVTKLWISAIANVAFAGMIGVTLSVHWTTLMAESDAIRSIELTSQAQRFAAWTNISIASTLAIFGLVALCQALWEIHRAAKLKGSKEPRIDHSITSAAL